ncbi:hypothetical protein MASR2M54_13920 [Aliarcobacter cryaerophilus]
MKNSLLREKIISHEILTDDAIVDEIYLYFRPVMLLNLFGQMKIKLVL